MFRNEYCRINGVDLTSSAIIYLTCGSPVAMHYLYSRAEIEPFTAFGASIRLLFWPVFVGKMLVHALSGLRSDAERLRAEKARELRNELESLIGERRTTSEIFDLRLIFDRYFALATAVSSPEINSGSSEFLDIAGHPQTDLATRCLNRKMAKGVRASFLDSRHDMLHLLSSNALEDSSFVARLATFTNDPDLEALVSHHNSEFALQFERLAA